MNKITITKYWNTAFKAANQVRNYCSKKEKDECVQKIYREINNVDWKAEGQKEDFPEFLETLKIAERHYLYQKGEAEAVLAMIQHVKDNINASDN